MRCEQPCRECTKIGAVHISFANFDVVFLVFGHMMSSTRNTNEYGSFPFHYYVLFSPFAHLNSILLLLLQFYFVSFSHTPFMMYNVLWLFFYISCDLSQMLSHRPVLFVLSVFKRTRMRARLWEYFAHTHNRKIDVTDVPFLDDDDDEDDDGLSRCFHMVKRKESTPEIT